MNWYFLLGDLIDLINKDNTFLRFLYIVTGGCQQLGYYALDIVPIYPASVSDVASAIARGTSSSFASVFTRISLTGTGGTDHKDIGLLDLDRIHGIGRNSLIMVVYRDRE